MPTITSCRDILHTSGTFSVNAFPIFFDHTEYLGLEYGMSWCAGGDCHATIFTICSDLAIGDIQNSGDGVSQTSTSCQYGPAVPAWAWVYVTIPSLICLVPHAEGSSPCLLDCSERPETPISSFCVGVYGEVGDDPCEPTNIRPATWDEIRAMFR